MSRSKKYPIILPYEVAKVIATEPVMVQTVLANHAQIGLLIGRVLGAVNGRYPPWVKPKDWPGMIKDEIKLQLGI